MGFSCEGCGRYIEGVPHSISGKPFCDQCRAGTEQAYHARGAGSIQEAAEIIERVYQDLGALRGISPATYNRIIKWRRELGADTGTTPSRDCVWTVEQNGAVHSVHSTYESAYKEEGENLRIGGPWQVLPWREAERGTTPPEGLAFTFEEFIDMSLRHNKRLAAGISGIASFGHWYNEMLAATQRAPVEQGPSVLTEAQADRYAAFDDWYDAALKRHKRDELPFSQRAACDYAFEAGMAAAPDHAREGALREALEEIVAVASGERQVAIDDTEGMEWIDKRARRALADGKEGQ